MGTKNIPGLFDCHAEAEPDEPIFTLLARDPLAANLVRVWAELRNGNTENALHYFGDLVTHARKYKVAPTSREKVEEAKHCALSMEAWNSERTANNFRANRVASVKDAGVQAGTAID